MRQGNVVVIGAGPAGLAAAHELTNLGMRPIVIEMADRVGGIARTESYQGYHFDIGGHRFFTKMQKIEQLWHGMMGDDFLNVTRLSRIYYRGRFFEYPLNVTSTLINLGIIESLLILASYIKSQIRPEIEAETFEQWVTNRFGRRLYEVFFKSYTEKVWGIPCHEIRAEWAAQRIKGLSLIAAVSNALIGTQKAKSLIDRFHYPSRGPGMMWERFQEKIERAGGHVRLGAEAVRLRHEKQSIVGVTYKAGGRDVEITADYVISSIPIPRLVELLSPATPDDITEASHGLTYRAFIIVVLIIDNADIFPDQWIYVHSPEVRVGRVQNFKNWSPAMVPDVQKTSVGMEYFCNVGDETWEMSDENLTELAASELSKLGLAGVGDVTDSLVVRQPYAYPIYDRQYQQRIEVVRNFIDNLDNLQTIGRNGLHRYNNMDHSMLTGMLAAQNVAGADHNLWEVNDSDEYLEEDRTAARIEKAAEQFFIRTFARIDKLAFATAVGSVSGLLIFMATIWLVIKGGDVVGPNLRLLSQYFIGYTVTVQGAFIAFGYSFFWGFLYGWLFAYLRNLILAFYIYRLKRKAERVSFKDFLDNI
jgi:protoporphyrinogen oxidase